MPGIKDFFSKDNFNASPEVASGLIEGAAGIAQGLIGRKKRKREQIKANKEYKAQRAAYEELDTSNLYSQVQNAFTENVYEDLTVNTQQADFMAQQQSQNQANIMQGLSGAAGGSGIAGLAQALANQSTMANQKASASIGLQESKNQQLAGKGALAVQKGEMMAEQMRLKGATASRTLENEKVGTTSINLL